MAEKGKFGVRVFLMDTDTICVMQTVKRGTQQNSPYVIDQKSVGEGERFVDVSSDKDIADAIRTALNGRL